MRRKLTAAIAMVMFLFVVASFFACSRDGGTATTAPVSESTAEAEKTEQNETVQTETTVVADGITTTGADLSGGTTAAAAETTAAGTINAPVGTDIVKIVAFYNQYANATKDYTGKITVQRNMGTVTTITKFGISMFKGLLQDVLDKQLKDEFENKTFVNGKNPADSNDTLEKFLPRGGGEKMSILTPAGVKSASCVKDGNGWKVTIVLIKEESGIDTPPKYHSSVMDPLEIDSNSLDPFTLGDGKVIYGQINAPYDGATLIASVNPKGFLDHLRMDAPLQISGKLGYKNIGNIETVIDGKFWGDMTFTY